MNTQEILFVVFWIVAVSAMCVFADGMVKEHLKGIRKDTVNSIAVGILLFATIMEAGVVILGGFGHVISTAIIISLVLVIVVIAIGAYLIAGGQRNKRLFVAGAVVVVVYMLSMVVGMSTFLFRFLSTCA